MLQIKLCAVLLFLTSLTTFYSHVLLLKLRASISILCSHPVRRASANVVSIIAKYAIPAGEWPELLPFLFQCSQSPQEDHREVSFPWWRVYSYQADEYRKYSYWRRMTLWFLISWLYILNLQKSQLQCHFLLFVVTFWVLLHQ